MPSTKRLSDEEAFEHGFYGIPDPEKRAKMSPEKLAIELSKLEKDSPPYILLGHELNMRLAKEQAKATLSAGWLGAGATLFAVLLSTGIGYWFGASQQEKQFEEHDAGPREKLSSSLVAQPDGNPTDGAEKAGPTLSVVPPIKEHIKNAAQLSNPKP